MTPTAQQFADVRHSYISRSYQLAQFALSPAQFLILDTLHTALEANPELEIRYKTIEQETQLGQAEVQGSIKRLEDAGLMQRCREARDRLGLKKSYVYVTLTEKGKEVYQTALKELSGGQAW